MARAVNSEDGYLEALVKNMPSETVAGYLTVMGFMSAKKVMPEAVLWVVWGLFLVATPLWLFLLKPSTETEPRPWWQVWIFAPLSFIAWSMTIGGAWAKIDKAAMIGSCLVLLLSALIFPLVSMAIAKATKSST
jgi:hypothetical protein